MDRMGDSGSLGTGSIPVGATKKPSHDFQQNQQIFYCYFIFPNFFIGAKFFGQI